MKSDPTIDPVLHRNLEKESLPTQMVILEGHQKPMMEHCPVSYPSPGKVEDHPSLSTRRAIRGTRNHLACRP
jgi:hypothetical protein